jgi:hypothetical protein
VSAKNQPSAPGSSFSQADFLVLGWPSNLVLVVSIEQCSSKAILLKAFLFISGSLKLYFELFDCLQIKVVARQP